MPEGIALIAGLGNPGSKYAETRHNAGFRFIDALLSRVGGALSPEKRFEGEVGKVHIAGREIWLIKPDTYMNHSGDAVGKLARFYKIPTEAILAVHDELDIPPGAVRLKVGGGHGGHNGLRDMVSKCGGSDFVRLRIGIGHPGQASQVADYVLRKAPAAEQSLTDHAIQVALDEVEAIVQGDYQAVMNRLHTHAAHN